MTSGVLQHPDWYPGLTSDSSFEDFQDHLHGLGMGSCPLPCERKKLSNGQEMPYDNCEGPCQADADCSGDLQCFQRSLLQPVPGCDGEGEADQGYCHHGEPVSPTTATTTSWPIAAEVDIRIRLTTFNVYYAYLGTEHRLDGVAADIADISPDIATITELREEKPKLLERLRQKSGRNYHFCERGPEEMGELLWDGDILYDADLWEALDDGIKDWGANRGLSWAVMRHRASGRGLLVYGAHPVCCGHEDIHLQNAVDFAEHLQTREWPRLPVVIMGDFNTGEQDESMRLYTGETVQAFGKTWTLPLSFTDAFRAVPANKWSKGHTFHKDGWTTRLDYILTENRQTYTFETQTSWIKADTVGGSDHYPLTADVILKVK